MKEIDLLQSVFDSVPAMIWLKDRDNVIIRANAAAAASIGKKPTEMEGRHTADLYPDMAEKYHRDDLEVISTGRPMLGFIERYEIPTGEMVWVRTDKIPYRDESGNVTGVLVFATDVTKLKQAEEDLENSRQELRELADHRESAREGERTKFAREIHDELGQQLTLLKIDYFRRLEKLSAEEAESFSKRVDSIIHSLRRISSEMRPLVLDDLGLEAALEWLCEEFRQKTGKVCSFHPRLHNIAVPPAKATAFFRICQEALTNAARHSGADRVEVYLLESAGVFSMEVKDNGRGISREARRGQKAFGLEGMRERALALGGEAEIGGEPGKGTRVFVKIPVE